MQCIWLLTNTGWLVENNYNNSVIMWLLLNINDAFEKNKEKLKIVCQQLIAECESHKAIK